MQIENLTFNDLPRAVTMLANEVSEIKQLLLVTANFQTTNSDCWLDLKELCDYLPDKPSKMTVYSWVHNQSIPFHKGAKKLRFLKSEIDTWLKQGKKISLAGPEIIPEDYLRSKGTKK